MAVPDFQTMMLPVLTALADSKPRSVRDVSAIVAKAMGVSEADLQERLPSGYTTKWANRIAWVGTHFNFAGLITRPARAQMQITERGLKVLKDNPQRVDLKVLQQFSDYQNARRRKKEDGETMVEVEEEAVIPPLETLEKSYDELRKALCAELLELIKSKPPIFFERLVLQLMQRLGYGRLVPDSAEHLGGSGDGGVDGLIKEDKLGLSEIYMQAKRWDTPVGSKTVREFLGALDQAGAKKGVLITTSTFTKDAKAPLGKTDKKVSLIDGQMLAELMIDHDLGVSPDKSFHVKKIDSDFFEED
ncbi:MAG: restriction endonuclease [Limisphaerales bacterium]